MSTIDVAKQSSVEELINRGCIKAVQCGNFIFKSSHGNAQTVTLNKVNPSKSIVIAQPEEMFAYDYDTYGDKFYKTRVAFLSNDGSQLNLYATYKFPVDTMIVWQVIEFY